MIHHILLYRFRPGIDRIDEHLEMIAGFGGNTGGLVELKCGRNIGHGSSQEFTHGFVMSFTDREALDRYNHSEAHGNLVSTFGDDIEDKMVIDFEDA